jgi:hypothetical protein
MKILYICDNVSVIPQALFNTTHTTENMAEHFNI